MRGKDMMERMAEAATRTGEPLLRQPILELCSDHRVLIEHHKGIGEYSSQAINVKVKFGSITVSGTDLEVCRMTSEQLVIIGSIESITLVKGRGV